jgi:hypothetical protein
MNSRHFASRLLYKEKLGKPQFPLEEKLGLLAENYEKI